MINLVNWIRKSYIQEVCPDVYGIYITGTMLFGFGVVAGTEILGGDIDG